MTVDERLDRLEDMCAYLASMSASALTGDKEALQKAQEGVLATLEAMTDDRTS